ncbi:hypothetical protein Q7C36_021587 [Tachysurus vachellii]|uniref:Uncharacterized protein n=1 Tax=Tachysurus vachellii TaxID=175792 RepID=A0AA88IVN0_TACVA|nr:hypothetical protein Q7C36_021587 [Tachysurus vachellii]
MTDALRVSFMVLGNTMNAHKVFMDKLKSKVKLHEVSLKEQSDVIIAFVPIVSRAGTDIQAALDQIPKGFPHQRIILVSLHHTFDPGYIAPDSRHSVNRSDVFAVDCLFYEDQGLLNSQCNDKALNRVINHLGGETPPDNVSVMSWLSVVNNIELISGIMTELILLLVGLLLPEGYSYFKFFMTENFLLIILAVILNYFSYSKLCSEKEHVTTRLRFDFKMTQDFPPIIKFFVMVLGNTLNTHRTFLDRLKISPRLQEVFLPEDSDVIFAFVPVVSRAGTDIVTAVEKIPQTKPVVLVVLHHTFNHDYVAPDSRTHVNKNRVFAVDCLIYEEQGLLNCMRNEDAIRAVKKHLNTDNNTENNRCDFFAMLEQHGIQLKWIYIGAGVLVLLIIIFIIIGVLV